MHRHLRVERPLVALRAPGPRRGQRRQARRRSRGRPIEPLQDPRLVVAYVDGVIAQVAREPGLVEVPAVVPTRHLVHGGDEVLARRVREAVTARVRAQDAGHDVVADQGLQGLEAQRGLAVGVQAVGLARGVLPAPPGHDVALARPPQPRQVGLAASDPDAGGHHRPGRAQAAGQRAGPEVAPAPGPRPQGQLRGLLVVVAVEALVEPGLLELVVAHEPVPELVPALVDGHALGALEGARRVDGGAAREERRVLHPSRGRGPGGVHDRDLGVGVGRAPGTVAPQGDLRGLDVAGGQVLVLGLHEQADIHRRIAGIVEAVLALAVAPAGRPGEVVDVVLVEMERPRVRRRARQRLLQAARGAHHQALGHREAHVVDPVVGEELRGGVELVGIPAILPVDADLREPLGDEVVVVDPARAARVAVGDARGPLDAEPRGAFRRDGRRRRHLHDGLVVGVAVVGLHVAQARRQVDPRVGGVASGSEETDRPHLDVAEAAVPLLVGQRPGHRPSLPARGGGEVVAEGVPVEVEGERGQRDPARVPPVQDQGALDRVAVEIQARLDGVARVARRALGQGWKRGVCPQRGKGGQRPRSGSARVLGLARDGRPGQGQQHEPPDRRVLHLLDVAQAADRTVEGAGLSCLAHAQAGDSKASVHPLRRMVFTRLGSADSKRRRAPTPAPRRQRAVVPWTPPGSPASSAACSPAANSGTMPSRT